MGKKGEIPDHMLASLQKIGARANDLDITPKELETVVLALLRTRRNFDVALSSTRARTRDALYAGQERLSREQIAAAGRAFFAPLMREWAPALIPFADFRTPPAARPRLKINTAELVAILQRGIEAGYIKLIEGDGLPPGMVMMVMHTADGFPFTFFTDVSPLEAGPSRMGIYSRGYATLQNAASDKPTEPGTRPPPKTRKR